MAKGIVELLETISTDSSELKRFQRAPAAFADEYELSSDEKEAVSTGDATKLRSLLSANHAAAGVIIFVMVLDNA